MPRESDEARRRLQARVGHEFSDPLLLEQALTHRSVGSYNNERLEFIGDAVLNFVVAEALFRSSPTAKEGALTRGRAQLVRRESLAEVARELNLGAALRLGPGELKSGGRGRDSILADGLEALVGALLLDAGLETCRRWVLELFAQRLTENPHVAVEKDAKTRLQELLQADGLPLPVYTVVKVVGAAHEQRFTVACQIEALEHASQGTGVSRQKAEQAAACTTLESLASKVG